MIQKILQLVHLLLSPLKSSQRRSVEKNQSPMQHWLELTSDVTSWTRFNTHVDVKRSDDGNEASVSPSMHRINQVRNTTDDQSSCPAVNKKWQDMSGASNAQELFDAQQSALPVDVVGVRLDNNDEFKNRSIDMSGKDKTACLSNVLSSDNLRIHERPTKNPLLETKTSEESPASLPPSVDPVPDQSLSNSLTLFSVQDSGESHPQSSERFVSGSYERETFPATAVNTCQETAGSVVDPTVVQVPQWTPLPVCRHAHSTVNGLPPRRIQRSAGTVADSLWSD